MENVKHRPGSGPGSAPRGAIALMPVLISAKGRAMYLHFAALSQLLARMNGLGEDQYERVRTRLKYFQRRGFPIPKQSARFKARLGMDEVLRTAFAFELLNAGQPPERAIRVIETSWPEIRETMVAGWWRHRTGRPPWLACLAAEALREIGSSEDLLGTPLHEMAGSIDAGMSGVPRFQRLLLVDAGSVAQRLGAAINGSGKGAADEFDRAMQEYGALVFSSDDTRDWRPASITEAAPPAILQLPDPA